MKTKFDNFVIWVTWIKKVINSVLNQIYLCYDLFNICPKQIFIASTTPTKGIHAFYPSWDGLVQDQWSCLCCQDVNFLFVLIPYRRRLLQGLGVLIAKKRLHSKSVIADHLESEKRNKGFILFQTLPRGSQKLKIKCQIGDYQPKISLKIMTETNLLSKHLIAISIGCCSISNIDY